MFTEKFKTKESLQLYKKCKAYGITAFLVIALSLLFYFLLKDPKIILGTFGSFIDIISPILVGFVFAFILNPIMLFYEKIFYKYIIKKEAGIKTKKAIKYICVSLTLITGIIIILLIISIIVPSLVKSISEVSKSLPDRINEWGDWISNKIPNTYIKTFEKKLQNGDLSNLLLGSLDSVAKYFSSGVKSVYSFVLSAVVGLIVSFYVLSSKDYFKKISQKFLCVIFNKKASLEIVSVAKHSHKIFTNFIVGKLIDSLIIGILCLIFMLILGLPYAPLISFLIGVTNIIPFFGPFIGAIPSAILILLDTPIKALYFVIMIIILQQLDGNVIGPRILKESLGISSFWIVFSIMFFGGLYGLLGMLFGAPLFAVIYNIAARLVDRKLRKKGLSTKDEDYYDLTKTFKE